MFITQFTTSLVVVGIWLVYLHFSRMTEPNLIHLKAYPELAGGLDFRLEILSLLLINPFAAFDPLFYMHHANVDRLYAFWEYTYPEYWFSREMMSNAEVPLIEHRGTFDTPVGTPVDSATPLSPFRKSEEDYLSSEDMRFVGSDQNSIKKCTYLQLKTTAAALTACSSPRLHLPTNIPRWG